MSDFDKLLEDVARRAGAAMIPFAYESDGTYAGRLQNADECPEGCIVRWERAKW